MSAVHEGGCQCGAVRYRVDAEPVGVGVCRCRECQRQSGSAFGMSYVVPREGFRLLRGQVKTFTRTSESGRPVVRAFCPECGTRLYHEPRWRVGVVNVKPGTFDDPSFVRPTTQVLTSRQQPWLDAMAALPSFPQQPF